MQTEDGSIIEECLNGKPQVFGILVDKYKEGIYAYVHAELRDFQDAQDVTQEVFLQAYRDLRSLRRRESFAFWLYRIAHRRCVQWFRVRSRRADKSFIEDQDSRIVDAPALVSYREGQVKESVQEALDSLPNTYREVLMLHYFGGMTIKDIAKAIGASPAAIGMRLSRARAQLKEELITMMDTAYREQRLPAGFTFQIVEAAKRIKIDPMPRLAGLPWGLSLAIGVLVAVLSLNPHMSIIGDMAIPAGSPLPMEAKALRIGEIPVDILKTSEISIISNNQGDSDGGQSSFLMAPQQDGGGKWIGRADMPTGRFAMAAAVVDDLLYIVGGYRPQAFLNTVEMYDPVTDRWEAKAPISKGNLGIAATAVNGKVYAIGGWDLGAAKWGIRVEEYNPATNQWSRKANMPTGRNWAVTAVVDGIIYAIGGADDVTWISNMEAYDPVADKWSKKADLPIAALCSAAAADGKIYVMGFGNSRSKKIYPDVYEYDPKFDVWTRKADMLTPRVAISTVAVGQYIYAIGGTSSYVPLNKVAAVEIYDVKTDTWKEGIALPEPRAYHVSALVDKQIYVIGGVDTWPKHGQNAPAESVLGTVESFELDAEDLSVSPQGKLSTTWGK